MTPRLERHQLFISYSRADRQWVDRLKTMLAPLLRDEDFRLWDDSQIPAGSLWKEEIAAALATAKVALLLVSPDFLQSDFINREELPPILRAASEEGLVLLWVKLRHCLVHRTPIHAYQSALSPTRPLSAMEHWEQEEALETLALRVEEAFHNVPRQGARDRQAAQAQASAEWEAQQREERAQKAPRQRDKQNAAAADATGQAPSAAPAPPPGLTRQRLNDCAVALLRPDPKGGEGQWQVQSQTLAVWGVVEELALGVELELVEIGAGRFVMGSPPGEEGRDVYGLWPEEAKRLRAIEGVEVEAQRLVTVPGFWLGRVPITQAQWQVVAGWPKIERELNPDPAKYKGMERPVERVSWHDAMEFCLRLGKRTGRRYSLPSEALWEYACRAGTTTPFHFGATLSPELANFRGTIAYGSGPKGEYREHTTPVGSFPANAWGLHDMHGNVWEWCLDRWHPSPRQGPNDGRPWLDPAEELSQEGQELRLLRGGSWSLAPLDCRSAARNGLHPASLNDGVGFRVCCLPPGFPSWPSNP
ncbi:MAG: SUMF1/EgtB/PvdO family nonheme iron enzyme [Cyanobium sp.]